MLCQHASTTMKRASIDKARRPRPANLRQEIVDKGLDVQVCIVGTYFAVPQGGQYR